MLHLTRGGREAEAFRHPYLALLRQFLLELLPRPASLGQAAAGGGSPTKGALGCLPPGTCLLDYAMPALCMLLLLDGGTERRQVCGDLMLAFTGPSGP